ncbi:hypothetical protein AGMMS50262_17220 [Bacteroidia bacterium]|nr:hypothetical protein AGMMS50262_17220 [Bacteroidia bacterium]
MKLKIVIKACVIVMCFALFSCSQDEEVYSCDKEVNAWVKENLVDIQQMTREGWLQLDESVNRATYVAFAPEQKQEFWLQKLQEVLSLDWNELEKSHIEALSQKVIDNPNWFSKERTKEESEEYDLFQYKWIEYAQEELGWTLNQVGSIALTGNKVVDKQGGIQMNTTGIRLKSGSEKPSCGCNQMDSWCGVTKYCSNDDCDGSSWGCGLLGLAPCNGLCKNI